MTSKTEPLITIGITCYNAESTIEKALVSAKKQTWQNLEIIIVDDCSSDNSLEILQRMAGAEACVQIFRHKTNQGYAAALNTIIDNANGEFVAIFDDDDESDPKRLVRQYKRIIDYEKKHKTNMVMCYTNREVHYQNDIAPPYNLYALGRNSPEPHGKNVADYLLWHPGKKGFVWGVLGSCTLMSRTATLKKTGKFDTEFKRNAEWDFAIRLAQKDAHFIAVNEPLVKMTKTLTQDKAGKIPLHYSIKLRKKYKDYLKKNNVYYSAIFTAYSRYYGGKNKKAASLIFRIFAILSAPQKQLPHLLEKCIKIVKK